MRKIKFRRWNGESMEMVAGLLNDDGNLHLAADNLMQYTGLKDKNGKEIYEGDIVDEEYQVEVYFDRGQFLIRRKDRPSFTERPLHRWIKSRDAALCPSEVIGNIYENPELLSEGAEDD